MMDYNAQLSPKARPVLKWAGGKRQLLPELMKRVPTNFGSYHEPFVGGGALYFELSAQNRISTAFLSDINSSLIDVYKALQEHVDEVIEELKQHRHDKEYYYQIRALKSDDLTLPQRAARVIYLNRTCYNGLYRENRSGQFNVPFGRHKNPLICDETNLRAVSRVLQSVNIARRPFSTVVDIAQPGDFVYFDPPYHPVSTTANFTSYDRDNFGEQEQIQLRDIFVKLKEKGVKAMLSNSDTPFTLELYAAHIVSRVYVPRLVNSKAESRGKVAEILVCNYDPPESAQPGLFNMLDDFGNTTREEPALIS